MTKFGLAGLGYLGKIHLKLLKEISTIELIGIYDIDQKLTKELADQYGVKAFNQLNELIEACDAVDVVTPSQTHFAVASECIKKGKHVFIEKPVTPTVEEALQLQSLAKEAGVHIQVGHVERFNPAYISGKTFINKPQYIEIERLALYNPRGTDVSVTLDLMIHDLDLLLDLVKSNVKKISANGVTIISKTVDVANAKVEFENGCVANITANRISQSNVRNITAFQGDNTININLLDKTTQVIRYKNASKDTTNIVYKPGFGLPDKEVVIEHPIILPTNAIKEELLAFHNSIITGKKPVVSIDDAIEVLRLAYSIDEKILHQIS
jgi:predicted dehydrogenase